MKRPSYVLRLLVAVGIVTMMFAGLTTTAVADDNPGPGAMAFWDGKTLPGLFGAREADDNPGTFTCSSNLLTSTIVLNGPECSGAQEVYFAAVANGGETDFPLGSYQTSVSIQNLDFNDAYAFIFVGNAGGGWTHKATTYLSGGASKTFTAADLGIAADAAPVPVVAALYNFLAATITCTANAGGGFTCAVPGNPGFQSPTNITSAFGLGAFAAGVAKQAAGTASLPFTGPATTAVSGYNGVSGREVGWFDQLYFPIAQTNCGPGGCWDTILRIANVGTRSNSAVTVRFFPADNASGSLDTGFQFQTLMNPGETWSIDLDNLPSGELPAGWVGSVHVFTDDAVIGIADRVKAGSENGATDFWLTNTASNEAAESFFQVPGGAGGFPYALFAPDVRMDFNGWNTGINVANLSDADNTVNIQYFGNNGNAPQGLTQEIHPHGMTYFYNPSDPEEDDCQQPAQQVPTCDFIGAAIILSEEPVAVAVDGVKYFGLNPDTDNSIGQGFTYSATGNVFDWQAMPLVQKGSATTGMGATSGINFLNPNANATMINVRWLNPSGFAADNYGENFVWVPGYATGFVYSMFQQNIPNGFFGSAIVSSELPIAATSANVDYQVDGDGTVVWNLYNPCGLFRQPGECQPGGGLNPGNTGRINVTVLNNLGAPVAGATVTVTGTTNLGNPNQPANFQATQQTDANGRASFIVPPGVYDVAVTNAGPGHVIITDNDMLAHEIDDDSRVENVEVDAGETVEVVLRVQIGNTVKILETDFIGQGDAFFCVFTGGTLPANLGNACERRQVDLDNNGVGDVDANGNPIMETNAQILSRLQGAGFAAVAVSQLDANGDATVNLPTGGTFIAVFEAAGVNPVTHVINIPTGQTHTNEVAIGAQMGTLTKSFVDANGDPLGIPLTVTITNAQGQVAQIINLGPPGTFTIPLPVGNYTINFSDASGLGAGDPAPGTPVVMDGSEQVTITAGQTTTVVNGDQPGEIEFFSVLNACVIDTATGDPIEDADVRIFGDYGQGVVPVAMGTTDADGEIAVLLPNGSYDVTADADFYAASSAGVVLNGANAGDGTCDVVISLDAIAATATVTKVVELNGTAVENASVALLQGACPATITGNEFLNAPDTDLTNANGVAGLALNTSGGTVCVVVVAASEFGVDPGTTPLQILSTDEVFADVGDALALTNEIGGNAGILDVFTVFTVLGFDFPQDIDVHVFLATCNDQSEGAGFRGGCEGQLVASSFSGVIDPTGQVDFLLAGGLEYCISADPNGDNTYTSVNFDLPNGDPEGDTDVVVREIF